MAESVRRSDFRHRPLQELLPHIINNMHGFIPSSDDVCLVLCQVVHSRERRLPNGEVELGVSGAPLESVHLEELHTLARLQFSGLVASDSPEEDEYVLPLEPVCSLQ